MQFGVCVPVEQSAAAKAAGWDFVEENVQSFLQGLIPNADWKGLARAKASALPIPVANSLVPPTLKITGPDADLGKLQNYIMAVMSRAAKVGIKTVVFGSGGARNVPDGFDRARAKKQILQFIQMALPIATSNEITLVAEPLNRGESNIINTVSEAMEYVQAINHPNFLCLLDCYHSWVDNEPMEEVRAAMPWIKHIHLADKDGRLPPGLSGTADYRPFFKMFKEARYAGPLCVEAIKFDLVADGAKVLAFIKKQWAEA